jgi:signal recognition particle receptor subunit beta
MVFLNYTAMQMTAKIVYYGPGLCGKTTNLQWIHGHTAPKSRGDMVSLETEADRTLFFDLLPLDVGMIGGMKVRLQLYTVPGQVFYNATRRLVLKGVDGVVFVADSQVPAAEPNEESLSNLRQNLEELGIAPHRVPLVLQYNKRDLRNILSVEALQKALNPNGAPSFEAAAVHGVGVFETLKEISRLSLDAIRAKIAEEKRAGSGGTGKVTIPALTPPATALPEGAPAGVPAASEPAPAAAPPPAEAVAAVEAGTDPALMEPLRVEFAEEDTDKVKVRPVRTRGSLDIGKELEKLRAITAESKMKAPTAVKDRDVDRLFKDLMAPGGEAGQEIERKASLEVPEHLLKGLTDLRIHLGFDRSGREEILRDAVRVTLVRTRRLNRLRLQLDLELKGK